MEPLLQVLGIKSIAVSIAGLIGGIISLRFFSGVTPLKAIPIVLGGWACANYGTPALVEFYQLKADGYQAGIAFAIGLFGMSIVAAVFQVIHNTDWQAVARNAPVVGKFLGGNDKGSSP